jgi:hypothetical protein
MSYPFPELRYRGNFGVTIGVDYSASYLRAEYGGGYSETEVIFPGLMTAKLNYPALHSRVNTAGENGVPVDRLTYIWTFYRSAMDAGRRPFVMRVPPPLPEKLYVWEFTDDTLDLTAVNRFLATTGLSIRQVYVKQMNFLPDGSIGDADLNPARV